MKKTDFSVSLRDGVRNRLKQYSRHFSQSLKASVFLLGILLWQSPAQGQTNCPLFCYGVQISLGLDCTATVTPGMVADTSQCVGGQFGVYIYTLQGDTIPNATLTASEINTTLIASVVDFISGNTCWSYITVQDKAKPSIECVDITISCLELLVFDGPIVTDNCDPDPEVLLLNETAELLCDPLYIKRIVRTYQARDASGNVSDTCQMEIYLERIDFSEIIFPDSFVVINDSELECDGDWADADEDGIPDPLDDGLIPGTGVPTIDEEPIYPEFIGFCNALTTYEDFVLPQIGCVRKVMRVWNVREWHCTGERDTLYVQLIEIVDSEGPEITCPADFTHTTSGHHCTANVWMPAIEAVDNCGTVSRVTVGYPGGFHEGNGNFYATLPVGANVITYTAYDQCYNSTQCTFTITIQDLTPPVAVCDEHTVVSLTLGGIDGLTKVDASVFDDGSFDACGPVTFLARRMDSCINFDWTTSGAGVDDTPNGIVDSHDAGTVLRPKVPFACCDAGAGPIMVELRVTDASGNVNSCMVEVIVQDKIPPVLTCPTDVTISCDYPLDINNLSGFGTVVHDQHDVQEWCVYDPTNDESNVNGFICGVDGLVIDNCNVEVSVSVTDNRNNCGAGEVWRTFTATDANGTTSCTQVITVYNFDPIVGDSIDWPDDYHGLECAEGTDPEDLEYPYDYPRVNEDACDLVGITYEDVVFPIVDNACFKILRTWKVIEWCLYEEYGGIEEGINYWEYTQVIKVVNQFGPEFLTDQPEIDRCNNFDCSGIYLELIQRADDDCTPTELLQWSYAVDLNNDHVIDWGPFPGVGGEINASNTYPLGNHRIIYTFEDRCGNLTVAEQLLNLESCKAPVPVCINGLSTSLMNVDTDGDGIEDTGMIVIWASDFDASSYHPCGRPFVLSLAPDTTVTSLTFDCSHVGQGQIPVNLYATDQLGNQAYCQTYIIIDDNNDICNGGGNLTGTITGNISTETSENITDVKVELTGTNMIPAQTTQTGIYSFPGMPVGGQYQVLPGKNNDYKNGVNTLDLVGIQKHLLGLETFDSPYKMIAADANKSDAITAVDLIEIRKLILGVTTEFPNNSSWRFIEKSYVFPNIYNPWEQAFPENGSIDPLHVGINQIDFRGVKVGDVNNTVKANFNSVTPRSSDLLELVIEEQTVAAGQVIEVPVYAGDAKSIQGMQWTVDMSNGLEFVGAASGQLEVSDDNFGWLQNRTLTSSWFDVTPVTLDPAQPLFVLQFRAGASAKLSQSLKIDVNPTTPEAYSAEGDQMDIEISFRGVDDSFDFELLQNEPNPFNGSTRIGYVLPANGEATLTLFDVTGRQILVRSLDGVKGNNVVELTRDQINAEGIIYYQVQFQGYTATKKMMIL